MASRPNSPRIKWAKINPFKLLVEITDKCGEDISYCLKDDYNPAAMLPMINKIHVTIEGLLTAGSASSVSVSGTQRPEVHPGVLSWWNHRSLYTQLEQQHRVKKMEQQATAKPEAEKRDQRGERKVRCFFNVACTCVLSM
ncbi:uncharacterized protein LOC144790963 [Lissotriton helveticus]